MILAHRGARKVAPENTLAAFKKAIKLGFDGVEMDIMLTKDGVPVVSHNDDLSHTTRSTGLISETLSYDLAKVDAGSLFGGHFRGEPIPTLDNVLALLSEHDLFIDIELKRQPHAHGGVEEIVSEMIYHHRIFDRVLVSSFSPLILRRFHKISPKIPTALIIGPHPFFFLKTLLSANMLNVKAIKPVLQYTGATLVNFARKRDWKIFAWTVTTRQEYMKAVELGLDGVIADEPELLKVRV